MNQHVPDNLTMVNPNHQHPIPPMTHPLGRHWSQPSLDEILIDDEYAVMTEATLKKLAEYSCSTPSGVYPGKMWRIDYQSCHPELVKAGKHRHWLCWFDYGPDESCCLNRYRRVLLV